MNKKAIALIVLTCIATLAFTGCGSMYQNGNIEETIVETTLHVFDVDYSENEDGTYICRGITYKYKIEVSGVEGEKEATFLILTNNKEISFETVSKSLSSAITNSEEPEFIILGWY